MAKDIGAAMAGLGWMDQVHIRGYRRLPEHCPDRPPEQRFVMAAGVEGTLA